MIRSCFVAVILALSVVPAMAQQAPQVPPSIPLWPNGAPGSEAKKDVAEVVAAPSTQPGSMNIRSIHNPSITPYLPAKDRATGVAVLVFPGGGHRQLAISHEGYNVGEWLASRGIAAFVVKYRLAREPESTYKIEVEAMADTQRAIRTVRARAAEWNINPDAVGMIGFSAGGELVAISAMQMEGPVAGATDPIDQQSAKPNFQAMIYPGQSGKIIPTKDSPPVFLAAGNMDRQDIAEGLADVYLRFKRAGVSAELHMYAKTGHGFGLRPSNKPPAANWPRDFEQWLVTQGFLKQLAE